MCAGTFADVHHLNKIVAVARECNESRMSPDLDQLLVVSHHLARGHNKGISFCVQILANPCTFFQNLAFFLPDSFQDLKQFLDLI